MNAKDLGIEGADFIGYFGPDDPSPADSGREGHGKELGTDFGGREKYLLAKPGFAPRYAGYFLLLVVMAALYW